MLIKEVIDLFLHNRKHHNNARPATITSYTYALRHFTDFMENTRERVSYQEIGRLDMIAFTDYIKGELDAGHWSRSRYALVVKTLKAMFHWIEKDEDCREEELKSWATRMPKAGKVPRREFIPSPQDLKKWQKGFKTTSLTGLRDYMIFSVLLETGMRRGELASLKVTSLQIDRNLIHIEDGKQGSRIVHITTPLAELLKTYLRRRERSTFKDSPYLFPSSRSMSELKNAQYISKAFTRVKDRLGLVNVTPHALRHAFCTYYLIQTGGDVEGLRLQSGHQTLEALSHYLHLSKVSGKHQQAQMEKASPLKMLRAS